MKSALDKYCDELRSFRDKIHKDVENHNLDAQCFGCADIEDTDFMYVETLEELITKVLILARGLAGKLNKEYDKHI